MVTVTFFSSNLILSKIIKFILRSPTSHCGLGFEKDGHYYILHSAWGGVQVTTRESVLLNRTIVAEYEILVDFEDELKLAAETRVGEEYDTLGLIGYIPVLIAKKFGWGIHNPLASKSATVCSEFIVQCDTNHEITEFDNLYSENVTPADLLKICESGKSFKRII